MGGGYNLRHLGMIATSPSWRRWFLPVMWRKLVRIPLQLPVPKNEKAA